MPLAPSDAVAALRSFPRRFRELIGDPVEPQVLMEAGAAATAISALAGDIGHILVTDNPMVGEPPTDAGDPATALERLDAAAAGLAEQAATTDAESWARVGTRGGSTVTAMDLLREAVELGAAHVRAAGNVSPNAEDDD